jgi:hypothetical protein
MDINIEARHVTLFVYNMGVLVTGMSVGTGGRPPLTPVSVSFVVFLAAGWTVYFNWRLGPEFFGRLEEDDEGAEVHPRK